MLKVTHCLLETKLKHFWERLLKYLKYSIMKVDLLLQRIEAIHLKVSFIYKKNVITFINKMQWSGVILAKTVTRSLFYLAYLSINMGRILKHVPVY